MSTFNKDLTKRELLFFAVGAGANISNAFYNQPLLPMIRDELGLTSSSIGWVPLAFQSGYAIGMLFVVPSADLFNRRNLILGTCFLSVPALIALTISVSPVPFLLSAFFVGATSILPQLFIPMIAEMAPEGKKGEYIGVIGSGMMVGLLMARSISGYLAALTNWRSIFLSASVVMAILSVALIRRVPSQKATFSGTYFGLLISLVDLFRNESAIRKTSVSAFFMWFACFAFWGALDFHLESPTFLMGSDVAGMFGLLGVAGALAAPASGRLSDKIHPCLIALTGLGIAGLGFVIFGLWKSILSALALGVILMDFGVQSAHVSNQNLLYNSFPHAKSRVASTYIFFDMCGCALGSYFGVQVWVLGGWKAVCGAGIFALILAFLSQLKGISKPLRMINYG